MDRHDAPTTFASPARPDARLREALRWSVAWSAACVLTLVLVMVWFPLPPAVPAALAAAALPGIAAQLLRRRDGERERVALLGLWALGGGFAAAATGGLGGPLAVFCLAPLAAAMALDGRKLVSGGAGLSLVITGVALWAGLTGASVRPDAALSLWLGSAAVLVSVGGFATAVIGALRRRSDESHEAEAAARSLERILAEQPHLILTCDADGRVAAAYGAAPAGVSPEVLFEQGLIGAAWHPDRAALKTALARAAEVGEAETGFTPRAALDRYAALVLRRRPDGRLIGVLRDASVQHAREARLEAARAQAESLNAGKSRFLANMSHELRTPLNAVIGFSDIMRQRLFGPLPEKYQEYAQNIWESGGHLLDLINDVLDMSKIEAERYELNLERFDAREPVSAALRLVRLQAHEAEISLRGVLPGDAVAVEADRRALKQITLNLLSNALKFTPSGGSVTVTLRAEGDTLELVVADTGVGIAPEDVQRLGRPFEQAGDVRQKSKGTGLGLSLVRAFAELHGGRMSIESTLGEGAAVTVRLPVVRPEAAAPREGAEVIPLGR